MTAQLRKETVERWLIAAKKVATRSQDGTALAIVDRLKKDGVLAVPSVNAEIRFDLPNDRPGIKKSRILLLPLWPEDPQYAAFFGTTERDENGKWSFTMATFKEEFNGITFRGDFSMSEYCTGSLMLHEGHHACRIPGQKIHRLNAMFRAHIELEAFLLQERLTILTGGEQYVAFRAFLMENISEYLKRSGQSILESISLSDSVICEINQKIEEYLFPIWGAASNDRDRFCRVADMMLYARFEMVRRHYPASTQHEEMKKIVALMYNLEEEVKLMQL